jgi:hypothetical protein
MLDLDKLERAIDGSDAEPSKDALASYTKLSKMLSNTLDVWQRLKERDLAALNAKLTAAGDKAINFRESEGPAGRQSNG